jgi:hypothetical protein
MILCSVLLYSQIHIRYNYYATFPRNSCIFRVLQHNVLVQMDMRKMVTTPKANLCPIYRSSSKKRILIIGINLIQILLMSVQKNRRFSFPFLLIHSTVTLIAYMWNYIIHMWQFAQSWKNQFQRKKQIIAWKGSVFFKDTTSILSNTLF